MVMQPALDTYRSQYFATNATNDGVLMTAPVQGATTSGSTHTRSELRETASDGTLPFGWSTGSGTNVMKATEAITHLPGGRGTIGFAQLHGPGSTWYLILEASGNGDGTATLKVKDNTGRADGQVIDARYVLGTKFGLTLSAVNGAISVGYNGVQKITTTNNMSGAYFKIGAYNQSSGDYGQVDVYGLSVTHQ
jgi:poly(beta-D-mannuronate) lyase